VIFGGAVVGLFGLYQQDDDLVVAGFWVCGLAALSAPVLDLFMVGLACVAKVTTGEWPLPVRF
jgi:hypothetical protein